MLERDGETVAVLLSPEDYAALSHEPEADPWADYDPARAKQALAKGTDALAGVDRDELLRDIYGAPRTGEPLDPSLAPLMTGCQSEG